MSKIYTSEQVSRGHVDKICDQIADAIVTDCLKHDKNGRVAVECMIKNSTVIIAGEITSTHEPEYADLVFEVLDRIGIAKLGYSCIDVRGMITKQSADIAMGVDKGGAGDQGIMFGYATNETPEFLPIPFAVATRFIQHLEELNCTMLLADAKAQVIIHRHIYQLQFHRQPPKAASSFRNDCLRIHRCNPLSEGTDSQ